MALAAMDSSESVELPIDYLQGHKDGLEWAAQLAEANHPETGDWVYDDPIELSKAIRKGPDMPPAQSVADSEPVIVVGDDGGDALSYRRLIQSFEPGTKLYRHAQPAPVVPNGLRLALSNAGIAAPESDEMLAATCEKHIQALVTWVKDRKPFQSAPVVPSFEEWLSAANRKPLGWVKDAMREAYDACRAAMLQAGNSPVIPDGSQAMLRRWLAFGRGMQNTGCQLPHNLIAETEAMLAAAPQLPGSETATVPGKWISVSERMPENDGAYLCWDNRYVTTYAFIFGAWQANQFIAKNITHWMPLPAGPQEVR
ncbi:DUF551 domain-containing protein [Klebsiella pneumoniae]|nr:DUF551 domain-containing protein [Klebsiella pneumoniae]WPH79992.1 DUF551 domain-containing protein [Klebsiella pneumoniae]WPH90425.1 DUF551 domain-containing protein [Klebsiella pneumoniae]WPI06775.1 DUF551 domain-containing protein [Klebsiella pneumoniae]